MNGPFLAVDWGTTNRRIYLIERGVTLDSDRDDRGVLQVAPDRFGEEVAALRGRWGDVPLLLAGMVGSSRGWMDAGYLPCPVELADLAAKTVSAAPDVMIVPGVCLPVAGRGDVMRGEEVQFLGAVAAELVPTTARLCQPGTHSKWARIETGRLVDFKTAMTGELFAVLRNHALIGAHLTGDVALGPAFLEGVAVSAEPDLLSQLFGVRAASLLDLRSDADAASYVSGLLIGHDCRGARLDEEVHVIADGALGDLYPAAIRAIGGSAKRVDGGLAFVAGMTAIWDALR